MHHLQDELGSTPRETIRIAGRSKVFAAMAVAIGALLGACSGYVDGQGNAAAHEEVNQIGEPYCANPEGANYSMAALAAATAIELRRWDTANDFRVTVKCNYSMAGCQEVVELTSTGRARCYDGQCSNVQAILDFQKKEASGVIEFPGGQRLQSDIFAQRLVANLKAQITCNSQPDNHDWSNCPAEKHTLQFSGASPGSCDSDYWFHAYREGTTQALSYPYQLKNQLITFGSRSGNPYLAFDVQGDDVKVDPNPGTVRYDPATSGSCPTLSSSGMYSPTDISRQCCSYKGARRTFRRSSFNRNYYLCM